MSLPAIVRLIPIKGYAASFCIVVMSVLVVPNASQAQRSSFSIATSSGTASTAIETANPDSLAHWIVLFADTPHAKSTGTDQFERDLNRAMQAFYGVGKIGVSAVRQLPIINGASFSAPTRILPGLLKLPYVVSFDPDHPVSVGPVEKSYHYDANYMTNSTHSGGLTGNGVIIAVIDTGVDYTHPDLGGCLGMQCRVIGGYDVVDGDNDPFDEHGHGTHVAGIAAGSGLSNGVAQQAKILAYRALDENGSGSTADVIDAIGRAVEDGAHIINLSLGDANGLPGSPQNLAVREAVRRGVLVVAAAGNSGPRWGTIGSPGSEDLALTVGALTDDDKPALFSSRGPVRESFALKPDISAPGVGILSAMPGGGHVRLNGTSMATPHVAGLAALMKERMPDADVLEIRSQLIQFSMPLPHPLWEVGFGKANPNLDSYGDYALHPASIGLLAGQPTHDDVRSHVVEFTLWNSGESPKTWHVSFELPKGLTADAPLSLSVPAGGTTSFNIEIDVDTDAVEYPESVPPLQIGNILFVSATDTIWMPVSVAKPSELQIEFQMPPSLVVVHDRNGSYVATSASDRFVNISLGARVYDVWAIRDADATKWIREEVAVKGSTQIEMLENDAPNTLRFEMYDQNGNVLGACGYSREYFSHKPSGLGLIYQYERSCPEMSDRVIQTQISDLSNAMRYEVSHVAYGAATMYDHLRFPFRFDNGIKGNQLLRAGGDKLQKVAWRYIMPSGVEKASFVRRLETPSGNSFTPPNWLKTDIRSPWVRQEFILPNPDRGFVPFRGQYDAVFALDGEQFDPDSDDIFMLTPSVYLTDPDSIHISVPEIRGARIWTAPSLDDGLVLGTGPDSWNLGAMVLSNGELRLPTSNAWFAGWNREVRLGQVELELLAPDGTVLENRMVRNGVPNYGSIHPSDWIVHQLEDGLYRLMLTRSDTWFGNRAQTTTASISFNRTAGFFNASCVERVAIIGSDGQPIQFADHSEGLNVVVEGSGCTQAPTISISHWLGQEPHQLTAMHRIQAGIHRYTYSLPTNLDSGHYDLNITAGNDAAHAFSYSSSPAFAITHGATLPDPPEAPRLLSPSNRQFVFDTQVPLEWDPVDGAIEYRIQLSRSPNFSDLLLDNLTSASISTVNVYGYGLDWHWRVAARNAEGWGPWSLRRTFTSVIESTDLVEDQLPAEWFLSQNYPNPFNPTTVLNFGVGQSEPVQIDIFTVTGQLVKSFKLGRVHPGSHNLQIDLGSLSSGLYLYRMVTPSFTQTRKMSLVK